MSLQTQIKNVRFLTGDTDSDDQKLSNENILFSIQQANNNIYKAAAICARALAARYASEVDTKFESISSDYSQLRTNYLDLAKRLDVQARKYGSVDADGNPVAPIGAPMAGGLTYSDIDAADEDVDRVDPVFRQDQFANPPRGFKGDKYGY